MLHVSWLGELGPASERGDDGCSGDRMAARSVSQDGVLGAAAGRLQSALRGWQGSLGGATGLLAAVTGRRSWAVEPAYSLWGANGTVGL